MAASLTASAAPTCRQAAAAAAPSARRQGGSRTSLAPVRAAVRTFELDSGAVALAPVRRQPRGVVHFLGGAFVGAAPLPVYSLLLERLADGGFTVVCTPYAVSFQHLEVAQAVHASFLAAVEQLRSDRQSAWAVPQGLPAHGVGHSNGSLLHLLIGSAVAGSNASGSGGIASAQQQQQQGQEAWRRSNVLMSYNNFQVTKAVPVPLSAVAPAVQQLRSAIPQGRLAGGAQQALQQAAEAARQLLALSGGGGSGGWQGQRSEQQQQAQQILRSLQQWDPAFIQLGSVFDEVGDGASDFTPTPEEARQLISSSYCVPDTLLVQFQNDDTDETPAAAAMLANPSSPAGSSGPSSRVGSQQQQRQGQQGRRVSTLLLPGSHVTPCGGDLPGWEVPAGAAFGPAQALAMAGKAVLQADTNRLADRVLAYLEERS